MIKHSDWSASHKPRKFSQLYQTSSGKITVSYLVKKGVESEGKREKQTVERKQIQEESRKKADYRTYYI